MSARLSAEIRIRRLERDLQRIRIVLTTGLLVVAALVSSGFGRGSDEVVLAERVELVDEQGVRHVILHADTLGFAVTLLDERGRPAGSLRLTEEPRVTVETGTGREVAGLGAPRPRNLTK